MKTTGRELYTLYHNPETKAQAQTIALEQAEPIIQRMIYSRSQKACDRDDMAQECRITVMDNLDKYDPNKGAFSTFIIDYVFNKAYEVGYKNVYGVSPYIQKRYDVDITAGLQHSNEDEIQYDIQKYLDSGYNTEDEALMNIEREINAEKLYKALEALPDRQKQALAAVYGLYGRNPMKSSEYAALMGCSRDRINDLCSRAIRRLQLDYGIEPKPYTAKLDRTGQKGHDRAGHPFKIIRYNGCKDVDVIVRDHDTYYLILSTYYNKLIAANLLSNGCKVNKQQITADTMINGKRAAAYI